MHILSCHCGWPLSLLIALAASTSALAQPAGLLASEQQPAVSKQHNGTATMEQARNANPTETHVLVSEQGLESPTGTGQFVQSSNLGTMALEWLALPPLASDNPSVASEQ